MFHNLAVPVLHLFILIVKFLSLYVDELNDDDDDDDDGDDSSSHTSEQLARVKYDVCLLQRGW